MIKDQKIEVNRSRLRQMNSADELNKLELEGEVADSIRESSGSERFDL